MQDSYSKNMFSGRVMPIGIIGDSNNQRPDKWSLRVYTYGCGWRVGRVRLVICDGMLLLEHQLE